MLNLGDVSIYSTFSYILEIVLEQRVYRGRSDPRGAQLLRRGGPAGSRA